MFGFELLVVQNIQFEDLIKIIISCRFNWQTALLLQVNDLQ